MRAATLQLSEPALIGARSAPFLLFTGGKGGVGKSTLAADLGVHLAQQGLRILTGEQPGAEAGIGGGLAQRQRRAVEQRDRGKVVGLVHRPWNSGSRFSMNAVTPSVKSSVRRSGSSWRNT